MKKIKPFFLLPLYFSLVLVQWSYPKEKGEYRLLFLHYENSSGEKGITTFEYDQGQQPARALWQLLDGSRCSVNFYTSNDKGKLMKKYREFSDKKTSTQTFKYHSSGQLVWEDFKRSDGVKGEAHHFYNPEGKLIRTECRNHLGWFSGIIYYQYDNLGHKTGATLKRENQKIGWITYSYNHRDQLEKEIWTFNNGWNQRFRYEYDFYQAEPSLPYTSANIFINHFTGYKVVRETYDYSGQGGGPSEYFYLDNKLLKKTYTRKDGLKTLTYFFYNGDHQLVKSLRQYGDGKSGVFTYTFNPKHRLSKRTFVRTDGKTASEVYTYDPEGKIIKGVWENFDSWLSGTLYFTYDAGERLKSGKFKSHGEKIFSADITFNHDGYGNVSKIHWLFSFNASQTYTFFYQKNKQNKKGKGKTILTD